MRLLYNSRLNATLEHRNFMTKTTMNIQEKYLDDGRMARLENHVFGLERMKASRIFIGMRD